jgi:hypothetical protein
MPGLNNYNFYSIVYPISVLLGYMFIKEPCRGD